MGKPWKKYLDTFKNLDKIAEGIKNNMFKKEHIEALATSRYQVCNDCNLIDTKGDSCLASGTQPCCSDCGCSLKFKLRSLSSSCPKGYWDAIASEETEGLINKQIEENESTTQLYI
jgi:hypothetical protein